ncbi:MAG: KR domain-containing protein, partial [bacterium]|nr:KR domain-containing protein [bacterium]
KARETGIHSLLFLFQALARSPLADADAIDLTVVSSRAQAVSPEAAVDYWKAPAVGLLPALAQQVPWLMPRHVDLAGEDPEEEASLLLTELAALPGEREVAWRDGERLVPRLEHYRPSPSAAPVPGFERGGFYLLSGGRGGIGVEIARFLRQRFAAHLLIVDRTPLPDEAGEAGHHAIVDVADGVGLEALVAERERVWQRPLAGVIHLAGSFHQRLLAEEDRAGLDEVLRPKLAGTWWLYQLLRRRRGGWFLGFSSVVATFGGATLGAYAAANRFLEAFTHHHHQAGDIPSFCFSWSRWEELGMSRGDALPA